MNITKDEKLAESFKVPLLQLKPVVSEPVTQKAVKSIPTDSSSQENSRKRIEQEGTAAP